MCACVCVRACVCACVCVCVDDLGFDINDALGDVNLTMNIVSRWDNIFEAVGR